MGGIVVSQSIRIAGDEFDQAILTHVRDAYNLAIGERTAEDIKIKVGSAVPLKDELDVEVNGRDVITGLPKTVRIESEEIRRALNKPLDEMAKARQGRTRRYASRSCLGPYVLRHFADRWRRAAARSRRAPAR